MPSAAVPLQTSSNIPLEQIGESPHNHRRHFDEAKLQELAESIKAHGVLQPVLVRPAQYGPKSKVAYELVYGHRRFRAAKLAKLKELPASVRELDDKAALEVALVENCRREDVLPMEEAEGYRELHEKHQVPVEKIAEQVGKSPEYVYGRLKLCALKSSAVRKALDAGEVSPSVALIIARIPGETLQEQAAKKILEGGAWGEDAKGNYKPTPMSYRRAAELVAEQFMLQLSKAPFNTKDAKLVPEAGACGACPKKTGNMPKALFPDVKSKNVCTDPECFGRKKAAAFKLEKEAAKAEGKKLLPDSKALWGWEGKELGHKGREKYFEINSVVPGDKKKRTFKDLLGDKAPVVLARDPNGKTHRLLEKEGLQEALRAAGHNLKLKDKQSRDVDRNGDWQKQRAEEAFRGRVAKRLLSCLFERVSLAATVEMEVLRLVARFMLDMYGYEITEIWEARAPKGDVPTFIAAADSKTLFGLVVEGLFARVLRQTYGGYAPWTKEICATFGVDLKDLEEEQRQADAAAPPASAAAQQGDEEEHDADAEGEEDGE